MHDSTALAGLPGERPLTRGARTGLVAAAAAVIVLFYLAALISMAVVALVVLLFLVVTVVLARVGMAAMFSGKIRRQTKLLTILARNLWLADGPTFRLRLQPTDAPRLFAMIEALSQRMGVLPPHHVSIEMSDGAWVQLEGYRQGAGHTKLGVGYDLLVGLSVGEVEAVLAHEIAHARLVQRGFSRWLRKGLIRLARLSREVSNHADVCRAENQRSDLANLLSKGFMSMGTRAVRLVETYSRQDEFEADRGAAEICSAVAMRSALRRLESLSPDVARLPWNERVARVHPDESFSEWLSGQLARADDDDRGEIPEHAVDPYSTHPALRDRLAALSPECEVVLDSQPGITLLAEPDRVAERLMTEIQRVLADLEAHDTKAIARSTRRVITHRRVRRVQVLGAVVFIVGLIVGISALGDRTDVGLMTAAVVLMAIGGTCFRLGKYRDRNQLPVPAFGTLTNPRPASETVEELGAAEKSIEADLRERFGNIEKKRDRLDAFVAESWKALGDRDYLRAHVAARLGYGIDRRSPEVGMGTAVAAAGIGNFRQSADVLDALKSEVGWRTRNTKWAAVWALSLIGEWEAYTEGMLSQLHEAHPEEPTFASLLALAQVNRGKPQSAVRNAEKGRVLEPGNVEHTKLIATILLTAGRAREAADRLRPFEQNVIVDSDALLLMVRTHLMLGDTAVARERAEQLRCRDNGRWLVPLGAAFESARLYDDSSELYTESLSHGFYPLAHIGLARIATTRNDKQHARTQLLAALNFDLPVPPDTASPGPLFHDILTHYNSLGDRREVRTRWIATMPADELHPLSARSIMVCASSRHAAEDHLAMILSAMKPDVKVPSPEVQWREAPKDQQSARPSYAGVEYVIG